MISKFSFPSFWFYFFCFLNFIFLSLNFFLPQLDPFFWCHFCPYFDLTLSLILTLFGPVLPLLLPLLYPTFASFSAFFGLILVVFWWFWPLFGPFLPHFRAESPGGTRPSDLISALFLGHFGLIFVLSSGFWLLCAWFRVIFAVKKAQWQENSLINASSRR